MKKNLLDIRYEILELDRKIKDISGSVVKIYDEIEVLSNDKTDDIDYDMIRLLSRQFLFKEHPLSNLKDNYVCQIYLEILLSLVQVDKSSKNTIDRLIFIQWVLFNTKLEMSIEELFAVSLKINTKTFVEALELVPEIYKINLVMDALLVANISGQANVDILVYVANLCGAFAIDHKQLRILSIIAKVILNQSFKNVKKSDLQLILSYTQNFKHYLNQKLLKSVYCSQRKIVVEIPKSAYVIFKWKMKNRSHVKKEDVIAVYESKSTFKSLVEIKVSHTGTLFQFCINGTYYGVISHESDSKDAIKSWVMQRR